MSMMGIANAGKLIGVGVGPGDPELMTLKATRALHQADVIAYFAKAGNPSHSRAIAEHHLRAGVVELPLDYPVTTELPKCSTGYRDAVDNFYAWAAGEIAMHLEAGRVVAVICEGDPLFYGSYMHLHARLAPRFATEVIAGVTGMSGCWCRDGNSVREASHEPGHERAPRRNRLGTGRPTLSHCGGHQRAGRRASALWLWALSRPRAGAWRPEPPSVRQPRRGGACAR